jgi:tetratricopeptide (TPR) repeat protein
LAVIYSSIAQTFQDLDNYEDALQYYKFELEQIKDCNESAAKSLLNIAEVKEKLNANYEELYTIYMESFNKAELCDNKILQLKILRQLKELQYQLKINDYELELRLNNFDKLDDDMDEDNQESSDSSFNISSC